MVTVVVDGEDKTAKIADWTLFYSDKSSCIQLTCHFPSGKKYYRPLSECRVEPTVDVINKILITRGQPNAQRIKSAQIIGNKYVLIHYAESARPWIYKCADVELLDESSLKQGNVFGYLRNVAEQRSHQASAGKENIPQNTLRQLDKIIAHPDTVLEAYCRGTNAPRTVPDSFIYPFGLNESQMQAVEKAFSSQISVIEGPPGTGKTQTILNILANILLQNGRVAIVSNNNTAVENVYEKLAKVGLDYVVAKLGSTEKREQFFLAQPCRPNLQTDPAPEMAALVGQTVHLKKYLRAQNEVAQLRAEIDELNIEEKYLTRWIETQGLGALPDVKRLRLTKEKITDLMAFLRSLPQGKPGLRNRLSLLFRFGIIRTDLMNSAQNRQILFFALQHHYYSTRLQQTRRELAEKEMILQNDNVEDLLKSVTSESMALLKHHLDHSIGKDADFTLKNYHSKFNDFIQRFPIIGSSTHSIINSLTPGTLLDYVIIDEASQQDIIPGILALACARNIIVVGDRKQLPHVPEVTDIIAPTPHYDCSRQSLLDSLFSLYADALPVTLLKEHYRCHPKIIHFCNKQFYDSQLVVMTQDKGEAALSLIVTARGNHERHNSNQRELESFLSAGRGDAAKRGFIAPYNAQVSLSERLLPAEFVNSTVHKFQGRECEQIVFSTVIDKKADARALDFVDDPHLINVAVSRAQKQFTIVTGENVFAGNNKHIAALVRYMTYYADDPDIHHSPVVSAFDLLYEEYDHSLENLKARLNPEDSTFLSEQIAMRVIRDVLRQATYRAMVVHKQILLRQLVTHFDDRFDPRQQEFMAQGASCDFFFYFRVGKQPFAVIEVDGHYHDTPEQRERDALKAAILEKSGITLLRLRTVDSQIEAKIAAFLQASMQENSVQLAG
ncbi:AAA domain-containing protein [Rahnella rivi]|uniref:AAA domain-containing protein n=1 Tax=Rahnella rivi TaxID=2816249 RepID=UPI0039BE8022